MITQWAAREMQVLEERIVLMHDRHEEHARTMCRLQRAIAAAAVAAAAAAERRSRSGTRWRPSGTRDGPGR